MGRAKLCILLAGFALFTTRANAQQTIQFSQYVFNGLAMNPAYAGYREDLTANLSTRIQWVGINGAPQTATASVDGLTNDITKNVGVGLVATVDRLGPESTSTLYANYAYRLRLDELDTKRLCFGVGVGVMQYSLNGASFNSTDTGDGNIPAGTESRVTPDFRFGIYYSSPGVYFGASVFNLLAKPITNLLDNTPIITQVRTFYVTAGTLLPLTDEIDIKPSIMIKEDFKGPTNMDLTAYLAFKRLVWLGASYRTGVATWSKSNLQTGLESPAAAAALVQFYINDHFRIGYSYDFTLSKLANYQSGTHELSVSLSFPGKKPRVLSPRYF